MAIRLNDIGLSAEQAINIARGHHQEEKARLAREEALRSSREDAYFAGVRRGTVRTTAEVAAAAGQAMDDLDAAIERRRTKLLQTAPPVPDDKLRDLHGPEGRTHTEVVLAAARQMDWYDAAQVRAVESQLRAG
jgi:hypothetical protein